ncbi:MAG: zeta toxin family protein, partial [Prosthecobacter sp.]|nr:zeta toxin family protein [Prosthecobacter sp.]
PFMEAEKARKARERELLIEIAEKTATALQTGGDVIVSDEFRYTPYDGLSLEERRIEVKFAATIAADLEGFEAEYKKRFGIVLDRNSVQEFSPDYAATRESRQQWSVATLEPAGAFVDWMFERIVASAAPGEAIIFNAGGQGSGKTTATRTLPRRERVIAIMDGTLQNADRSREHLSKCFAAGLWVDIRFIYCPWRQALANMVKRAVKDADGGRIVPVFRSAGGHHKAARTVLALSSEFDSATNATITVVDNSSRETPAIQDLDWLSAHLNEPVETLIKIAHTTLHELFTFNADDPAYSQEALAQFLRSEQPGSRGVVQADRGGHLGSPASGGPAVQRDVGGAGQVSGRSEKGLTAADLIPAEAAKQGGGKIIMATVKGDVHDIGKNIVGV